MKINTKEPKKLSEYAKFYEDCDFEPLAIIKNYLVENDLELEAVSMISYLSSVKAEKIQDQLDYARSWIPNLIDLSVNKGISKETAALFDKAAKYFCLGMEFPDSLLTELHKAMSYMETPKLFFVPLRDYLEKKYDLFFADRKQELLN